MTVEEIKARAKTIMRGKLAEASAGIAELMQKVMDSPPDEYAATINLPGEVLDSIWIELNGVVGITKTVSGFKERELRVVVETKSLPYKETR